MFFIRCIVIRKYSFLKTLAVILIVFYCNGICKFSVICVTRSHLGDDETNLFTMSLHELLSNSVGKGLADEGACFTIRNDYW